MLSHIILVFLCLASVGLFVFAYLMDRWHGPMVIAVLFTWMLSTQPADAAPPDDSDWPTINQATLPILVGHNVFGDKIILFANFCAGDGSRQDHMHTFGIYNAHGMFIRGGCWKWEPESIKRQHIIQYFDMGAGGWDTWPVSAFHIAGTLPH